jgi:hypothetical protein
VFFRFIHPFVPVGLLRALDRLTLKIAPKKFAHHLCLVLRRRE